MSVGGYDETFVSTIDQRYICPICHRVLKDAVQTNCGHRFCKICFNMSVSQTIPETKRCPMDNTELTDVYQDTAFNREVMSLNVFCRGKSFNCSWQGELRNLESHLEVCKVCPIPCGNQGCDVSMELSKIENHRKTCSKRTTQCEFCTCTVCIKDLTKHILLECLCFPILCTVCLSKTLTRNSLIYHISEESGNCPMTLVKCPFHIVGCDEKMLRFRIDDHLKDAVAPHSILLLKRNESSDIHAFLPPFFQSPETRLFHNSNHSPPQLYSDDMTPY
ncbi:hypothetical protein GJ496_012036 [Pomphorhynchus laevis]|nr:hypothetical protein GJ496_012036 [Pomphorhynchus laevis]